MKNIQFLLLERDKERDIGELISRVRVSINMLAPLDFRIYLSTLLSVSPCHFATRYSLYFFLHGSDGRIEVSKLTPTIKEYTKFILLCPYIFVDRIEIGSLAEIKIVFYSSEILEHKNRLYF